MPWTFYGPTGHGIVFKNSCSWRKITILSSQTNKKCWPLNKGQSEWIHAACSTYVCNCAKSWSEVHNHKKMKDTILSFRLKEIFTKNKTEGCHDCSAKKNQYFRLSGEGIKFWRSIADKIYFVTCFFFADKSTLYKFSFFFPFPTKLSVRNIVANQLPVFTASRFAWWRGLLVSFSSTEV